MLKYWIFLLVLRRTIWKNKLEITYVGPSQVLINPLDENEQAVIVRSQHGGEIDDIRIMGKDSYLVARTEDSLLVADLAKNLLSEVRKLVNNGYSLYNEKWGLWGYQTKSLFISENAHCLKRNNVFLTPRTSSTYLELVSTLFYLKQTLVLARASTISFRSQTELFMIP